MKKLLLLVIVSLIVSCKDSGPKKIGTSNSKIEQPSTKSTERDYERFVYDVDGVIYGKKETTSECSKKYYLYIELKDGNVFEWEITEARYKRKNIGSPIHFDFLRIDRFSNKAL